MAVYATFVPSKKWQMFTSYLTVEASQSELFTDPQVQWKSHMAKSLKLVKVIRSIPR